jgi:SOS response associated peptidase (SRAP)
VLTIAGLWDEWKNRETGERLKSCSMIITEPNECVAEVHDRMPVLLKPDQFEHWLSGNMGVKELKPVENDYLHRWAVSKRINYAACLTASINVGGSVPYGPTVWRPIASGWRSQHRISSATDGTKARMKSCSANAARLYDRF